MTMTLRRSSSCPQTKEAAAFMATWIESSFQKSQKGYFFDESSPAINKPTTRSSIRARPSYPRRSSIGIVESIDTPEAVFPTINKQRRRATICSGCTGDRENVNDNRYCHTNKQMANKLQREPMRHHPSYLSSYSLGDAGKLSDMIVDNCESSSEQNVAALRVHDFAFVRRANGNWTYAILSDKPDGDHARFVVNVKGATKIFSKKELAKHVRLIRGPSTDESVSPSVGSISSDEENSIATDEPHSVCSSPCSRENTNKGGIGIQDCLRSTKVDGSIDARTRRCTIHRTDR